MSPALQLTKQHPVIERILQYKAPQAVIDRYVDDYGVTETVAREHEQELKRFLGMCLSSPSIEYGMFGPVDNFWHTWILFTREWVDFSQSVFGNYIHHQPATREEKNLIKRGITPSSYVTFLTDYPKFFSQQPPVEIWPAVHMASEGADCTCSTCMGGCGHNGCSGGGAG